MIEELLTGRLEPGVHRWATSHREAARGVTEAEREGWRVFWLDGTGLRDKRTLLDRCAVEFSLPSYFGHNWDALQDCLNDLSWAPTASGYLVVYDHWQDLADADPSVHGTLLEIFEAAIAYWRKTPTSMAVLLPEA
ncbi:barstar family protein [Actinomadura sp. DC4]|uniref:barstar family protein n=1 Tax=Actinomadura sp. DC4 TaxID=3055069 RepID=UPI0025B17A64|nr:barstar family protein [Actinomadura sp. DC4]MDN3352858.1 barstar family protein [Actinomadura sp. DC4]